MRRLSNVLLCVALLALLAVPATALSQGSVQSGWASSPPNLNGKLGSGEWADATRVTLHTMDWFDGASVLGGSLGDLPLGEEVSAQQVTGWARFMNDARYLYLAATLDIGAPAGDPDYYRTQFYFVFEDEPVVGDGKWAANLCTGNPDEGAFRSATAYHPGTDFDYDYFLPASEDDWCRPYQKDPPGYKRALDWSPATFELRFDLQTSALDVTPGDCFNAGLWIIDLEVYIGRQPVEYAADGWWPAGLHEYDQESDWPYTFGEVCLAEAPVVEEEEFVPEAGTLALLGTGLASLGGYATLRWRSRRKQ